MCNVHWRRTIYIMRIRNLLLIVTVGTMSLSAVAQEKLPTAKQRFGGETEEAESPSFRRHVVPLASKLGCSGRECHGSFQGRGDFQLSLFGYDFAKDHKAITADKEHRIRVDLENPEKSLFIQKPTKQIKHKGGEVYEEGSWEHNLMLKWIQEGAKNDLKETGEFGRLELFPKEIIFKKAGESIQLKVLAHWADGTVEDVTEFTRFRTNDESVAEVYEGGLVQSKSKGDSHIVAFYDNGVAPVPVMLPVSQQVGSTSTRRLEALPADVSLLEMGSASPLPAAVRLPALSPLSTSQATTASARLWDRSRLYLSVASESVCPSMTADKSGRSASAKRI